MQVVVEVREVNEGEGGVVLLVDLDGRVRRPLGGLDGRARAPEAVEGEGAEAALEFLPQARRVGVDVCDLFKFFYTMAGDQEVGCTGHIYGISCQTWLKMLYSNSHEMLRDGRAWMVCLGNSWRVVTVP